jgi:hypothetical protein
MYIWKIRFVYPLCVENTVPYILCIGYVENTNLYILKYGALYPLYIYSILEKMTLIKSVYGIFISIYYINTIKYSYMYIEQNTEFVYAWFIYGVLVYPSFPLRTRIHGLYIRQIYPVHTSICYKYDTVYFRILLYFCSAITTPSGAFAILSTKIYRQLIISKMRNISYMF